MMLAMPAGGAPPESLSAAQARRIALASQGFADPRPDGQGRPAAPAPGVRSGRHHPDRLGQRAGAVAGAAAVRPARPAPTRPDPGGDRGGELFEYWAHEACHLPVALHPLIRWQMDAAFRGETWGGVAAIWQDEPAYVESVLEEVRERGPLTVGMLLDPGQRSEGMWGWSRGKRALEFLFWTGQITARRGWPVRALVRPARAGDPGARPRHADPDRSPTPSASSWPSPRRCLGVATERDLADYFRHPRATRPGRMLAELVEDGRLIPVDRGGLAGARRTCTPTPGCLAGSGPGRCSRRSTRWCGSGQRTERLFGMRYRIEIYVPSPSGSTATTCFRSCSATGSSPGSTSSRTVRPACCGCRERSPNPASTSTSWRPSCWPSSRRWRPGSASTASRSATGDLAQSLRRHIDHEIIQVDSDRKSRLRAGLLSRGRAATCGWRCRA